MAAPIRNRFCAYVYALTDGDRIAYIGKGTGRRLANQKRTFRLDGRILKEFDTEKEAFAFEREMIVACRPYLNKCAGGNGGTRKRVRTPIPSKLDRLTALIGGRAVSARMLLAIKQRRPGCVTIDTEILASIARLDVVDPKTGRPTNPFELSNW